MTDEHVGLVPGSEGMMETYTGRYINPLKPDPEQIDIVDIAHALSMLCRYTGHTSRFYSVAEHSIHVAGLLLVQGATVQTQLAGLLHDAAEAYMADIARPIKSKLCKEYKEHENRLMNIVSDKYSLHGADWAAVKQADNAMLTAEASQLMYDGGRIWQDMPPDPGVLIHSYDPTVGEEVFLCKFYVLKGKL